MSTGEATVPSLGSPRAAPGRRTGLVVLVPAADPVVGRWRSLLDPSAAHEMPAHATVLFPWFRHRELTDPLLAQLTEVASSVLAFEVCFERVDRFPATLWLAPNPSAPFTELTEAVRRTWPQHQPFEGRFEAVVPHLTVGDEIDPDAHPQVVADLEAQLPVRSRASALTLMAQDTRGRWAPHSSYPLGQPAGGRP